MSFTIRNYCVDILEQKDTFCVDMKRKIVVQRIAHETIVLGNRALELLFVAN